MRITNPSHIAHALFAPVGDSHCELACTGGVLIADDRPTAGGYTGDMYLKFNGDPVGGSAMWLFASKGLAEHIGLPRVAVGASIADGALNNSTFSVLNTIYTAWEMPTSGSTTLVTMPGDEPNQVTVGLSSTRTYHSESAAAHAVPYAHRHFYSGADWVCGVVFRDGTLPAPWSGGVAATKRIPLPLSEREFWRLYARGAAAGISNSDARNAVLAAALEEEQLIPIDAEADLCVDMFWHAADASVSIGRGMGTTSDIPHGSASSFLSFASSQGLKQRQVGDSTVNIPPDITVQTTGQIIDTGFAPNGQLFVPQYRLTGTKVGNQRISLAISPDDPRVLADLTRLASEVFPCSFDGDTAAEPALIYFSDLFQGCVETSMEQVVNPVVETTPLSMPMSNYEDWLPKYEDSPSRCMTRLTLAVRRAASSS